MEEILKYLETKIKELLNQYHGLKHSNQTLNQGKQQIVREKEALLSKQQKAITQVETLIAKLKAFEKLPNE